MHTIRMCFPDNDPLNLPLELVSGKPRIKEDLDQVSMLFIEGYS